MSTSFEARENLRIRPAAAGIGDRAAPPASGTAAQDRAPFFSALPAGWAVIGRCRSGTSGPGPRATGCYALAHPQIGVALIDIAPDMTPNAEARLRRALTAAEFWSDFPGTLPVLHDRVDGMALRSLPWKLERGFAVLPALTVPGGAAWIEGVKRSMATDPAWEIPGQSKATRDGAPVSANAAEATEDPPPRPARSSVRPRRWGRVATLPLAFAGTFALGLVAGFLLLESPPPAGQPAAVVAALPQPPAAVPTPGVVAPEAPTEAAETTTAAAAAGSSPASPPAAFATAPPLAIEAASPPAPRPAPVAAEAPTPAPAEPPAIQQAATAPSPLETRLSLAAPAEKVLPMAPPRAPAPPPVRVASSQQSTPRPTPVVDRACSQALFRFQQGERLTAAEQNFIRSGCSTTRR